MAQQQPSADEMSVSENDLESVDPWVPRGIKVYGTADIVEREGHVGSASYLRIKPTVSWSWNVDSPSFVDGKFIPHKTVHE